MIVVMVTSAGSTLDSTFTSLSKLVALERPLLGTNLYELALRTAGFFLPLALPRRRIPRIGPAA